MPRAKRRRQTDAAPSAEPHAPSLGNRRTGRWAWALSGEEGLTALLANQALVGGAALDAGAAQRYDRMLTKQRKLEERFPQFAPPSYR